jgi:hypothetical protein
MGPQWCGMEFDGGDHYDAGMASVPPVCFNRSMARPPRGITVILLSALTFVPACSNKLETGYEPRTIGSNEVERRGYYAAPFSKEAREARQKADYDPDVRRPRPGY